MANVIKLRKGLNVNLKGRATEDKVAPSLTDDFALVPDDFSGVVPKVTVREGDHVLAGETLFVDKAHPDVRFSSPVSGKVTAVERGERRKVLAVKVLADAKQDFVDFGVQEVARLSGEEVTNALLQAGLFGYINQLPYAVSTNPSVHPKAIFVSALRDMPLACNFEFELKGNEKDFQTGLSALSRIEKTWLNTGIHQQAKALTAAGDVELHVFDGPCPAGNVGVQINHLYPVNKGEVVWTVDPTTVIFIGRLFNTGKVDLRRTIALAGSGITRPAYMDVKVGMSLDAILEGNMVRSDHVRIINGNPLTGHRVTGHGYLGAHTSEVTVIPEGDNVHEVLGWMMPRFKQFSTSRSYFSWLFGKGKEYDLDARIKGGERHMIMSGEYDRVIPMDIYAGYLVKAIITGDIDKQEQLGIYEVSPEDFALAEFVDSSKLPLQKIVREGLNLLRKENA